MESKRKRLIEGENSSSDTEDGKRIKPAASASNVVRDTGADPAKRPVSPEPAILEKHSVSHVKEKVSKLRFKNYGERSVEEEKQKKLFKGMGPYLCYGSRDQMLAAAARGREGLPEKKITFDSDSE